MIHVTHDQIEAMTMGDRVAVLRAGRVEQVAPPMELYDSPATAFVARFLGSPPMNLVPAAFVDWAAAGPIVGVRPEHVTLNSDGASALKGRVKAVEPVGDAVIVHVDIGERVVLAKVYEGSFLPVEGEEVGVHLPRERAHFFDGLGGRAVS
jgi:ABC-type sugar transport system ATPase subunit